MSFAGRNMGNWLFQRRILHVLVLLFIVHQVYLFAQWSDFFRRNSSLEDVVDDHLELPYDQKTDKKIALDFSDFAPYENYFRYYLSDIKGTHVNSWEETKCKLFVRFIIVFRPDDCEDEDCQVIMPEFIILGAQKCGTTSLWRYLLQHPQILPLSEKARVIGQKEIRFFDEQGGNNNSHPLKDYIKFFSRVYELEKLERPKNMRFISGEGTPNYIRNPQTPYRIKNLLPNAKLIVLFREPVDRAYSQYQHALRVDRDKRYTGGRPYEDFVDAEIRILDKCKELLDDWFDFSICYNRQTAAEVEEMKLPVVNQKRLTWMYQTVLRSLYSRQLMNYAKVFPPEQILVVQSEDFYENTELVMKRIESFLDLKPLNWSAVFDTKEIYNFGKGNEIFISDKNQNYDPIHPRLRKKMERLFAPFNRELVRMFSDRGFKGWSYDNDT